MAKLNGSEIDRYLKSIAGPSARIRNLKVLGGPEHEGIKGYGYGTPVQIDYEVDGKQQRAVLHTVSPGPFGHQHMADRAQMLLWDHGAFNRLLRHVRSIDVGAFQQDGSTVSLGRAEEFFELTDYAEGNPYVEDMTRMRSDSMLLASDVERADALCDYQFEIHRLRKNIPDLYIRRIRELIGHSECIMGLIDSYPAGNDVIERSVLKGI